MKINKRALALLLCLALALSSVSALASSMFYTSPEKPKVTPTPTPKPAATNKSEGTDAPKSTEKAGPSPTPASTAKSQPSPSALPDKLPTLAPTKPPKSWKWTTVDTGLVHGIPVDDNLPLAETLQRLGQRFDVQGDRSGSIAIANVHRFLSAPQRTVFSRLSMSERLLLTAVAAGYPDAISAVTLSPEASQLYDQLITSASRKKALRDKYFPVKLMTIDYERLEAFTIELTIRNGGTTRERYTFADDGRDWYLVRVQVGEYR